MCRCDQVDSWVIFLCRKSSHASFSFSSPPWFFKKLGNESLMIILHILFNCVPINVHVNRFTYIYMKLKAHLISASVVVLQGSYV